MTRRAYAVQIVITVATLMVNPGCEHGFAIRVVAHGRHP